MNIKLRDGGGKGLKFKLVALATTITLSGAAAIMPLAVIADHSTAHTIEQLQAQIAALSAQLASLSGPSAPVAGKCSFTRDLTVGVRGDDVTCLQNYLTGTGHFTYAGGATGYFGSVTKSAVSAWQAANAVSPTAGYFGSKSQAKYNSMVVAGPAPAPGPVTPGPVVSGSGLTVTASSDQPAATLAVDNGARIPFTKVNLTASADGDVTVKSITVERQGLADDAVFDGIVLLDEQMVQVGLSKTLNADHKAILSESFVVKAGTSRMITIAGNMDDDNSGRAGQVVRLAVTAVDAGSSAVNGSFPIFGNGMTVNATLDIGSLASPARGTLDPGAARTALEVGTKNFYASGVRWSVGSAEPVLLEQMRWNNSGSVAASDIKNVRVNVKNVDYDAMLSSDSKYYIVKFNPAVEFDKGATIDIGVKLDVESGSNRTIDLDLLRRTDVVARGKTFGYYIIPANGTSDPTDDTGAFSSTEPYYDAYEHTISKGTLRGEKSGAVLAGNITVDAANTPLGAFLYEGKGEVIQITSATFVLSKNNTAQSSGVTSVSLFDENGAVVAGPKDLAAVTGVNFTDTWNVPAGLHVYTLKGKLTAASWATNDTLIASTTPSAMTARGLTSGLSITPTPSTVVAANTQTVKKAAVSVSVSASPAAQNVVRGISGYTFAKYQFDSTASGEDVRVTSLVPQVTYTGTPGVNDLNGCVLYDGATALNTGSNVKDVTLDATSPDNVTFSLDNHLIVPKGTTKVVDLKCNITANAVDASTHAWGIVATAGNVVAVGKDTAADITEGITAATGQIMTVKTGGTLTYSLDSSSPSERLGVAGKTDVLMTVIKFHAANEAIDLKKIGLQFNADNASTSDFAKATLWDGATKVGEAIFTGSSRVATSTFVGSFVIPKDGDKLLTLKADLAALGVNEPARRGVLLDINMDGDAATSTEGVGQSSGTALNPALTSDTDGKGVRMVKTIPTLERLSVPSNTLTDGEMILYRFKVTADASSDIGLAKFTYKVATTGITLTLANVYGYSDASFSVNAYASNPITKDDLASFSWAGTNGTTSVFFNPVNGGGGKERVTVPAGSSRYFELRGTVTGAAAGDSATVQLDGDAANHTFNDTFGVGRGTLADVNTLVGLDTRDFIWSPNTTTTAATTTTDWLNGYLVPGLPNTNMSAQNFSK